MNLKRRVKNAIAYLDKATRFEKTVGMRRLSGRFAPSVIGLPVYVDATEVCGLKRTDVHILTYVVTVQEGGV